METLKLTMEVDHPFVLCLEASKGFGLESVGDDASAPSAGVVVGDARDGCEENFFSIIGGSANRD